MHKKHTLVWEKRVTMNVTIIETVWWNYLQLSLYIYMGLFRKKKERFRINFSSTEFLCFYYCSIASVVLRELLAEREGTVVLLIEHSKQTDIL